MVPCKSTAEEVLIERFHHRSSMTDSKVRTTLHVSIAYSGGERVKVFSFCLEQFKMYKIQTALNGHCTK